VRAVSLALAERRYLRLAVMCALYVAQGIPYGLVTVTLAAYLAGKGASTDEVGTMIAMSGIPWTFKFVLGPFLDRAPRLRMGRRRPWILLAQTMMILSSLLLISIPDLRADVKLLGWIVLINNIFVALQDVSVDALAIDLLPESERGVANGLMYGSAYVGIYLGGSVMSKVLARYDLQTALLLQVCMLAGIMLLPLLLRERADDSFFSLRARPRDPAEPPKSLRKLFGDLVRAFSRRSPLFGVLWAVCVYVGLMALSTISTVLLMQKLGWTQEEYGDRIGGFVTLAFGAAGAASGGWIADRLGHRRVLAVASVLIGLLWLAFAAMESRWPDPDFIVLFARTEAVLIGILSASFFATAMDLAWPRVAATQFTAFMAIGNLSRMFGSKLAGPVEDWFGTAGAYTAFAIYQIVIVVILIPIDPHQNRRELGTE
jgi:PAT family beta-lactamase induction signal transducer AmpG